MSDQPTTSPDAQRGALPPATGSACLGGAPKSFTPCQGCADDTCSEIKECLVEIYNEMAKIEEAYVARGVCSDCGACSLKDAAGKCRPRAVGDTGDYSCNGERLWEGQEDEDPQPNKQLSESSKDKQN